MLKRREKRATKCIFKVIIALFFGKGMEKINLQSAVGGWWNSLSAQQKTKRIPSTQNNDVMRRVQKEILASL